MATPASTFHFEIASPERVVLKATVTQVSVPTTEGEITVLSHHIPLVATLKPGVVEALLVDGSREVMSVSGGLVEVMVGKVVILADTAERAAELDEERILAAKAKAEELKAQARQHDDVEFARLSAMIEKELARERGLKRWRRLRGA